MIVILKELNLQENMENQLDVEIRKNKKDKNE